MPPLTRTPFVKQVAPVPVLLFGVATLRITCNDTWERRKALKSRQRTILVDLEAVSYTHLTLPTILRV